MSVRSGILIGFLVSVMVSTVMGYKTAENYNIYANHNTQEQCEYKHQTKCVNAWIRESMQNPKSKGVDNENK